MNAIILPRKGPARSPSGNIHPINLTIRYSPSAVRKKEHERFLFVSLPQRNWSKQFLDSPHFFLHQVLVVGGRAERERNVCVSINVPIGRNKGCESGREPPGMETEDWENGV